MRKRNIYSSVSWNWETWRNFWFLSLHSSSRDNSCKLYIYIKYLYKAPCEIFSKSSLWRRQAFRERKLSHVTKEKTFTRWELLAGLSKYIFKITIVQTVRSPGASWSSYDWCLWDCAQNQGFAVFITHWNFLGEIINNDNNNCLPFHYVFSVSPQKFHWS